MLRLAFCVLLCVFSAALAYNFEDEAFNEFLVGDLEDLDSTSNVHARSRRDEEVATGNGGDKCRRRRFKGCCADDLLEEIHERDRPIKKECFKKITGKEHPSFHDPFKCDKAEGHRKNMTCVVQCVFEQKDAVNADGDIKETTFRQGMKEVFGKTEWLWPVVEAAIPKCLSEASRAAEERKLNDPEACNPSAIKTIHCMFREIQLGCPSAQIADEKTCSRLRERLQKSDYLPGASVPVPIDNN